MQGKRKNKWAAEEEEALLAGIAKHGYGKWANIIGDPEFAAQLLDRTNIDLKDKWRNMKNRVKTVKSSSIFISPAKTCSVVVRNEPSPDMSNDNRYNAIVFEAISTINDEKGSDLSEILSFIEEQHEVPQNFRKLLSYSLRSLVSQDKLKKVQNRYKISVMKALKPTLTLRPKDSTKLPELPSTSVILTTSKETQEIDAAANKVAERINELAEENNDPSSSSVAMVSSDPSSEENIPYVEQLQRRDIIDSAGSSEDDTGPSGFTSDELVFKALETVYDDGNSMDIDEIFKCVQGRYEILEDFREKLEDKLGDLVAEGQVEKVGNRYRIPHGLFDTPTPMQSEKTQSMSSGDSKPQDIPSTSSSSVPTAPQENPKIDAAAKQVAEAEDLELQAKEAHELADKHTRLLNLESHIILQLAVEILNRCANGHKIFLR